MTDVAPGSSLLDWITGLVTDPVARERFAADPHGVLGEQGLADVDPADLHHAIPLVTDTVAARLDTVADGSTSIPGPLDGESGLEAAIRQITAIPDHIVPLADHELPAHALSDHGAVDLDDLGRGAIHDVPDGFDDPVGHLPHDTLDDPVHDAGAATHHPGVPVADDARPVPAFATGHTGPDVDAVHAGGDEPGPDAPDHPWHDTGWHDEPEAHDAAAHDAHDDGDHRLDQAGEHDDHHDTHHDPGAALGAG